MTIHVLTSQHSHLLAIMGLEENLQPDARGVFDDAPQCEAAWEWTVPNLRFRQAIFSAMYARYVLTKEYDIDFGFSAAAWRDFLINKSEVYKWGNLGIKWQPMIDFHREVEGKLEDQLTKKTARYASMLWNCLDRKKLLNGFFEKIMS